MLSPNQSTARTAAFLAVKPKSPREERCLTREHQCGTGVAVTGHTILPVSSPAVSIITFVVLLAQICLPGGLQTPDLIVPQLPGCLP